MPVVSTYQITRSATPFKTRGRPPFTPTGLSAGNKGLATSKNSSGIKPVAIAHLLVHGFMRQVCTRKSHAKFGFCQKFLGLVGKSPKPHETPFFLIPSSGLVLSFLTTKTPTEGGRGNRSCDHGAQPSRTAAAVVAGRLGVSGLLHASFGRPRHRRDCDS